MGWRGLLRSLEAERKRNERISQRRSRLVDKAHNIANRFINSMEDESRKELDKIKAYEERLSEFPISKCGLKYESPNKWCFDRFSDNKGQVTYDLQLSFNSDNLIATPGLIGYEKRNFEFLTACITSYGTFVAFTISYNKGIQGAKNTKLINRKSPDNSLIALRANDQIFFPIEGTIDANLIDNVRFVGIAVFEPFVDSISDFDIVFIPKSDEADQPETKINVSGDIASVIQKNNSEKSLYENFLDKLSQQKIEFENRVTRELNDVRETARQQQLHQNTQSGSGCFLLTLLAIFSAFFLLLLAGASSSNSSYKAKLRQSPPLPYSNPPAEKAPMAEAPIAVGPEKKSAKKKVVGYVTPEGEKLHKNGSCGGRHSKAVYSTDWQASLSHCSKCW